MSEIAPSLLELKRAVVVRPEDPDARYALALRWFEEEQLDGAFKQLSRALELRPDFPDASRLMARLHARAGRPEEARKSLEALIRGRPEDAGARDELAEQLLSLDRTDDALVELEAAARLQPHEARRLVKAAELAWKKGLPERALDLLARARATAPSDPAAVELLRSIGEELGESAAAPEAEALARQCPELREAALAVSSGQATAAKRALVAAPPEVRARPEYARMRELVARMGGSAPAPALEPRALLDRLRLRQATTTVGRINILGWTPVGGSASRLEAMAVPGKGELIFSGNVGPIGREAGQVAFTCLKARAEPLGIEALIRSHDLHLHCTDMETSKEGSSFGLALALAGVSAYRGKPLRPRLGATGSISLHGEVLKVAGIHEKVVAAYLGGLARVLLPRGNLGDAQQLPAEVRDGLELVFVESVADALGSALER
ncbi:MAG TPA: S16 family serine protease [Myxococcales bacterium]|nr:S16 family serine protease [Myxococcales bacterium]